MRQFSVFTPNRLGRLHELVSMLASHNVHVLALTILDTTDSAIIRLITDDPEATAELCRANEYAFTECEMLVVELGSVTELGALMSAMLEAEININYLYSFIPHPHGKSILALSIEDLEIAEKVLVRHQFKLLRQADLSR